MSKVRVYELARELKIESKQLISKLHELGIRISSHQSSLTVLQVDTARRFFHHQQQKDEKPRVVLRRRKKIVPDVLKESSIKELEEVLEAVPPPVVSVEERETPKEIIAPSLKFDFALPVVETPTKKIIIESVSHQSVDAKVVDKKTEPKQSEKTESSAHTELSSITQDKESSEEKPSDDANSLANKKKKKKTHQEVFQARQVLQQLRDDVALDEVQVTPKFRQKTVYTPTASRWDNKRRSTKKTKITKPRASYRVIQAGGGMTVHHLARQMSVKSSELIKKLMALGVVADLDMSIDVDTISLLAADYDFEVRNDVKTLEDILDSATREPEDRLSDVERAPIVTIMGHVDHGKTSILDAIRRTQIANKEVGGITQSIGAYVVDYQGKKITFLDTPGHAAFSAMRARGAKLTDIIILVVAADDGVMPQTLEAISHVSDAKVPVIVVINKIDKPNKNLDRIYSELAEKGLQSEKWGGEIQFIHVSALKKQGLEELLEAVLLQAEMLELRTNSSHPASGLVIEASINKSRGSVTSVMVQEGCLKCGDYIVVGMYCGRIKLMHNFLGKKIKQAFASTPVEVLGLSGIPIAGDPLYVVDDEKMAKSVIDWQVQKNKQCITKRSKASTLEDLLTKVKADEAPEVLLLIKADTQGSIEAISEIIAKLNTECVHNKVVHKAVGGINESDFNLAKTSGAVILGFNVRASKSLDVQVERGEVVIQYFSIIYELVDAVKSLMEGKLPPVTKEVIQGHAEVRSPISIPKVGTIAGSAITDGKITRHCKLRVIRDQVIIHDSNVGSLRRFKEDVKEVSSGFECGISVKGYQDFRSGDVLEAYIIEESKPSL